MTIVYAFMSLNNNIRKQYHFVTGAGCLPRFLHRVVDFYGEGVGLGLVVSVDIMMTSLRFAIVMGGW